jgi:hypothetical protein
MTSAMGGDMDGKVTLTNEKVIGNGSFGVVFQVTHFSNSLSYASARKKGRSTWPRRQTLVNFTLQLSFRIGGLKCLEFRPELKRTRRQP